MRVFGQFVREENRLRVLQVCETRRNYIYVLLGHNIYRYCKINSLVSYLKKVVDEVQLEICND